VINVEEKINKIWQTCGIFETFTEANKRKKELVALHQLVQVKRCGNAGMRYKVKVWDEPKRAPVDGSRKSKKKRKEK